MSDFLDVLAGAFLAPFYVVAVGLAFALGCFVAYVIVSAAVLVADEIRDRMR